MWQLLTSYAPSTAHATLFHQDFLMPLCPLALKWVLFSCHALSYIRPFQHVRRPEDLAQVTVLAEDHIHWAIVAGMRK